MSRVCVHGLGYIGLPTAATLATQGHEVVGYDVDPAVRAELRDGAVHFDEPDLAALVERALTDDTLTISDEVVPAAYHLVCVPTPFDEQTGEADLSYVESAGDAIATELRAGDTVILESTVPPRTTVDVLQPVLETSGLVAGEAFSLGYCPETVLPGNVLAELRRNDRIVGGIDDASTTAAVELYDAFVEGTIRRASGPTIAEFVKLIQNTYRDTNVALANEIATVAADYDVDARDAIALANGHPRVDLLQPGPGVGGHCLPIDPWFLGQHSDRLDLIERARAVNDGMTGYVIDLLESELETLEGATVAILGVAYKGNVDDTRKSPGLALARELQTSLEDPASPPSPDGGSAIEIALHDPYVDDETLDLVSLEDALAGADAVVIATDHDEYAQLGVDALADSASDAAVVDTRAILDADRFRDAGYVVRTI